MLPPGDTIRRTGANRGGARRLHTGGHRLRNHRHWGYGVLRRCHGGPQGLRPGHRAAGHRTHGVPGSSRGVRQLSVWLNVRRHRYAV